MTSLSLLLCSARANTDIFALGSHAAEALEETGAFEEQGLSGKISEHHSGSSPSVSESARNKLEPSPLGEPGCGEPSVARNESSKQRACEALASVEVVMLRAPALEESALRRAAVVDASTSSATAPASTKCCTIAKLPSRTLKLSGVSPSASAKFTSERASNNNLTMTVCPCSTPRCRAERLSPIVVALISAALLINSRARPAKP